MKCAEDNNMIISNLIMLKLKYINLIEIILNLYIIYIY
jgi:hypothetical protein